MITHSSASAIGLTHSERSYLFSMRRSQDTEPVFDREGARKYYEMLHYDDERVRQFVQVNWITSNLMRTLNEHDEISLRKLFWGLQNDKRRNVFLGAFEAYFNACKAAGLI